MRQIPRTRTLPTKNMYNIMTCHTVRDQQSSRLTPSSGLEIQYLSIYEFPVVAAAPLGAQAGQNERPQSRQWCRFLNFKTVPQPQILRDLSFSQYFLFNPL